jgi:putative sugar O-methyltransferase
MTDNWSCLEPEATTPYAEICREAVEDEEVFKSFKQDSRYTAILEHVSIDHGRRYFNEILAYDVEEELANKFKENDIQGSPTTFDYGSPFGKVSPSTLRYVKNTLDIASFVGEGDLSKIAEIGGGYGGLCKTISCLCDFDEYHIYDMPEASNLQKKYLSKFNIFDKVVFHPTPEPTTDLDLVVSNYAYSELNEELQDIYYNNVIVNSKRVYMILNKGQVSREVFLSRAEKDFDISIEKVLDFWPPNGYLYFTTMVRK